MPNVSAPVNSTTASFTGPPPMMTLTLSRSPAAVTASTVVFMVSKAMVRRPERASRPAPVSSSFATNFSGGTSTPRS